MVGKGHPAPFLLLTLGHGCEQGYPRLIMCMACPVNLGYTEDHIQEFELLCFALVSEVLLLE